LSAWTGALAHAVGDQLYDVRQAALGIAADVERSVTADPTRDERGKFCGEARTDPAKAGSGKIDPSALQRI
jgi:hypothetical protein